MDNNLVQHFTPELNKTLKTLGRNGSKPCLAEAKALSSAEIASVHTLYKYKF